MNPVLKKLGLTTQSPILILNAPREYNEVLNEITAEIHCEISSKYKFIQIFEIDLAKAKKRAGDLIEALDINGYLWFCYPKGTSKEYKSDINRDRAWGIFAAYEFEPVRQVAIDENWSAMRFKHIDSINRRKE